VSNRLNLDLTILDVNIVSKNFDIIIIEDELFDDKFPIRDFAQRFGIITKDKLAFDNISDFLLSKPFLPSNLLSIIEEQSKIIQNKVETKEDISSTELEIEQSEEFIETLVEDISEKILEESDESVVPSAFVSNGGILDTNELSKIQNILNDEDIKDDTEVNFNNSDKDDEWVDLSNIIDKAIDEVKQYHFDIKEPIKLVLNKYAMSEISPLLNKLDQDIVDSLVSGEEITLKLKVEK
jgi:hypothetical protein